jgi:hypothetical protein
MGCPRYFDSFEVVSMKRSNHAIQPTSLALGGDGGCYAGFARFYGSTPANENKKRNI